MRRLRRTVFLTAAAVVAAVVLYLGLTLPPATRRLTPAPPSTIYGAYHIHTQRSDGSGNLDDVAAAAAEAGLQFVIVTDHGDATRQPEAPQYLHGVLVIDAVEISTIAGHLVALGLENASPYPLGGEARDTAEDVHRMGGWIIAAHPDSPREGLRWSGDDVAVDAIEWINADSEWRDERPGRLILTLGRYLFRAPESIASVFERPAASLRRWDEVSHGRRVVSLAGVDAHAKIGLDENAESGKSRTMLARPGYRDMFQTLAQAVALPEPLSADAARDAATILSALRAGHSYSVVRAIAVPGQVQFSATGDGQVAGMGASLVSSGAVTISASVPEPADAQVVLLGNGAVVAAGTRELNYRHPGGPATYRTEVRLAGAQVPWIVTNPIWVGAMTSVAAPTPLSSSIIRRLDDLSAWGAEKHTTSSSTLDTGGAEVSMAFQLAAGRVDGQYAAMAYSLEGGDSFETVTATMRASAPMRVSVQVRQPGGVDGERWQRSVYVDETPREVTLSLQDFEGAGAVSAPKPNPAQVRSVLFVVDTWHTKPGASGTVWVSGLSIGTIKSAR